MVKSFWWKRCNSFSDSNNYSGDGSDKYNLSLVNVIFNTKIHLSNCHDLSVNSARFYKGSVVFKEFYL